MSQYPGQQAAFMQQAQMLLQQQMQQMQQMQQQGYVQPQQMQQQGYAQPQQLPQGYVMQQQYAQQPIGGYVQQSQPPYPYQQQPVGFVQQSQAYPYAPSQPGFVQPPPPYPMQQQMSSGFIAQPQLQPQPFLQHQNSVFINGGSVPQQQLQQQPQQQQILAQSFVQQTVSQPPVQQASFVPAPTGSAPFASAVQHVMMVQQQTPVTRSVAILDQRYVNQTQESLELVATKEKISVGQWTHQASRCSCAIHATSFICHTLYRTTITL